MGHSRDLPYYFYYKFFSLPLCSATLAGSGYTLDVDRIYMGGTDGSDDRYIGYLQNFYLGDLDLLQEMRGQGLDVSSFVSLPPLIYYPVTFPDLNTYVQLPPLRVPLSMVLHFMFKTKVGSCIVCQGGLMLCCL